MFTHPAPLARYRFTARVQQPLTLPDYAGSLLRGQFGAALRHVACMTRQPTCPGCPLIQSCLYTRIFESPPPPKGSHALQDFSQIPNPYIIEPPTPGARVLDADDDLVFHLVLVGHATQQLALIIFALQRALHQGLTHQRVPVDLLQVDLVDAAGGTQPVWMIEQQTLRDHLAEVSLDDIKTIADSAYPIRARGQNDHEVTLTIQTPLRLQQQGRPLGIGQLTPHALIATLVRRVALLMDFHAGPGRPTGPGSSSPIPVSPVGAAVSTGTWGKAARAVSHLAGQLTDRQELHWFDWIRYSSRQQQSMTLGGVLGRWTLQGDTDTLAQIRPWLWLGQWLHVGKNATMGLGQYQLDN
jgi:hypothetical protein